MDTKITTLQQVAQLCEGDTIRRLPAKSEPQNISDGSSVKDVDTFTILKINANTGILSLITTIGTNRVLIGAGEIGRLFIKSSDLVAESIWWVNTDKSIQA